MSCNSFWLSVTYFHIELLIFHLSNFVVSPGTTLLRSPATVIPLVPAPEKGKSAGAGGGRAGGCLLCPRPGQGDSPPSPQSTHGCMCKGSASREPALAPLKSLLHQLAKSSKSCHEPLLGGWYLGNTHSAGQERCPELNSGYHRLISREAPWQDPSPSSRLLGEGWDVSLTHSHCRPLPDMAPLPHSLPGQHAMAGFCSTWSSEALQPVLQGCHILGGRASSICAVDWIYPDIRLPFCWTKFKISGNFHNLPS